MPKPNTKVAPATLRPRFRIVCGGEIALGPGKAELLAHIQDCGSIAKAAQRMGMSYMRAWTLVQQMEQCFCKPLVHRARGGSRGGGAGLTPTGERVLQLYEQMLRQATSAVQKEWASLQKLLRD